MEISEQVAHIKEELKNKGWKYEDLSRESGIPMSTVLKVLSGNTANPRIDTIMAFERALNMNQFSIFQFKNITRVTRQRIPMLGKIACGKPIYASEDRESYVMIGTDINADLCLIASGDSMVNARILNGDIVFCREQSTVDNGDIAAVIIGEEATLKRVYYYPEKKKLVLQAENPKYEPLIYINEELEEIRIIGKAIAFQSDVR